MQWNYTNPVRKRNAAISLARITSRGAYPQLAATSSMSRSKVDPAQMSRATRVYLSIILSDRRAVPSATISRVCLILGHVAAVVSSTDATSES